MTKCVPSKFNIPCSMFDIRSGDWDVMEKTYRPTARLSASVARVTWRKTAASSSRSRASVTVSLSRCTAQRIAECASWRLQTAA